MEYLDGSSGGSLFDNQHLGLSGDGIHIPYTGTLYLDLNIKSFSSGAYIATGPYGFKMYTRSYNGFEFGTGSIFSGTATNTSGYTLFYSGIDIGVRKDYYVSSPAFVIGDNVRPIAGEYDSRFKLFGDSVSFLLYRCCFFDIFGELIYDFVPCQNDSDDSVGVFDVVNNIYYPLRKINKLVPSVGSYSTKYSFQYPVKSKITLTSS